MLAASTDNYTLNFNGNAQPRQQGRQDRDKQLRLYSTCCFRPLHFMGDHQSGKGICQLVHAFGQYVPLLRVQEDACSRRAMWQRLAWSSHTACMLTAQKAYPSSLASPLHLFHTIPCKLQNVRGAAQALGVLRLPVLQAQALPCYSRHCHHAMTIYLMSTPHLLLNDETEALRLQGAT